MGIDTGIDTAAQLNQGQYTGDNPGRPPSLMRAMAPGLAIWGGYSLADVLHNDPFAKTHKNLMRDMRKAGSRAQRSTIADEYFHTGAYAKQFDRAVASGRVEGAAKLGKIASSARFTKTAEVAYMRNMAAVNIGKFATAANAAFFLAPALYGATYHGFKGIKKLGYELETPKMGGHFTLNAMQATERQRTIAAMHNSEFNGRSAMGNEAFLMHQ